MSDLGIVFDQQQHRNRQLLDESVYMKDAVESQVLPLSLNFNEESELTREKLAQISAIEKRAATISLSSLASLAKINELDHLGGGLELIPSLLLTLLSCGGERQQFAIEHGHASIGYYSLLAVLGYLKEEDVVETFRRGLDVPGHVSWVPGGTQLSSGRLGVMVPMAVGTALGLRARYPDDAVVFCHCGDAGWVSGQALNGFVGGAMHKAPVVFIMNRNGIQLSDTCENIVGMDPRKIISACGIEIIEIPSLHDTERLFSAYHEAILLAKNGNPAMIFPTGFPDTELREFGEQYGISSELAAFADQHGVALDTKVWVPGSLMSWRDVESMCQCVFYVNGLPGGQSHHDGHMKGRELAAVLDNPLLKLSDDESTALDALSKQPRNAKTTQARPAPGSPNLSLSKAALDEVELPSVGKSVTPRNGTRLGYAAVAKAHPERFFTVSCDLDPSTRLDLAKTFVADDHKFEMGITEQASALMADGLSMSSRDPQLVVFATFAAFFEGIAREGLDVWRYHRNLSGANEGLNVTMHLSHVGACTGRDHFSGWSLDWINIAISYLPYLHRFYAPADARAAFLAVKDLSAHYGAHVIGVPRDGDLPILATQDDQPLWDQHSDWEPLTQYKSGAGAKIAILALGCTAHVAGQAFDTLTSEGVAVDVIVVNGLPIAGEQMANLPRQYPQGLVTMEDGLIGDPSSGLRGFAGLVQTAACGNVPVASIGITDPRIAPSHGFRETWEHFGITAENAVAAVKRLGSRRG